MLIFKFLYKNFLSIFICIFIFENEKKFDIKISIDSFYRVNNKIILLINLFEI